MNHRAYQKTSYCHQCSLHQPMCVSNRCTSNWATSMVELRGGRIKGRKGTIVNETLITSVIVQLYGDGNKNRCQAVLLIQLSHLTCSHFNSVVISHHMEAKYLRKHRIWNSITLISAHNCTWVSNILNLSVDATELAESLIFLYLYERTLIHSLEQGGYVKGHDLRGKEKWISPSSETVEYLTWSSKCQKWSIMEDRVC